MTISRSSDFSTESTRRAVRNLAAPGAFETTTLAVEEGMPDAAEATVTRDALWQALDRLVAFQIRHSRPKLPEAPQRGCVRLPVRRPTGKRR